MDREGSAVAAAYLEHLTDADLVLLAGRELVGERQGGELRAWLRQRRGGIEDLLARRDLLDLVLHGEKDHDALVALSPFLLFAATIQRAVQDLASSTYVAEWAGIGRRTPVFDVARLRQFAGSPWTRLFLAELLSSYTRVRSGSVVVATRRGLRRQRFSELDPARLAGLLEVVPDAERPGILRRLGDLALFLTGVFPDHVARRGFGPIEQGRLLRAGGAATPHGQTRFAPGRSQIAPGYDGTVALLEQLGQRWYRAAFDLIPRPVPDNVAIVGELPEHFGDARRILQMVTERFLYPRTDGWFGLGPDTELF